MSKSSAANEVKEGYVMPNLTVIIPDSLASILNDAVARRATSPDSVVTAALSHYFQTGRHRAYQISTSAALVQGVSEGAVSSRKLLANGDFGLGTFEHLDGEMVVLDGSIYQGRGDGTVEARRDDFQIPFAVVSLVQPEFRFNDIEGTLVCVWSQRYSSSFSIPGYHFHFISKDRTKGGHVLDCSAKGLRVGIQTLFEYDVRLPDAGPFIKENLAVDTTNDLQKAE